MKQNLVLDFDGTLVDAGPRDYQIYVDILDTYGCQPLPYGEYWALRRESTPISEVLTRSGTGERAIEYVATRLERCERDEYLALDALFPDVLESLEQLTQRYMLFIVSARLRGPALKAEIARLGLSDYFEDIIVTNGSKTEAIQLLDPVVAVVGDTEHDVQAAKSLGLVSIAVTTGIRSPQILFRLSPEHVVSNFSEATKLLCA